MPKLLPKTSSGWTGPNKARVRLFKARDVEKLLRRTKEKEAVLLSFPGTTAIFERLLEQRSLVTGDNMVALQTYERLSDVNAGHEIFKTFERTMKRHFPHCYIWPYNFLSFSKNYHSTGCSFPSKSKTAGWTKQPYAKYMKRICNEDTLRFSVMDIDLCGIFNRDNSGAVVSLFKNGVVKDRGVLFVTHQKGRDVRGGKLFDTLHSYLRNHPLIDYDSLIDEENARDTDLARMILVPLYYMANLYDCGYVLKLNRIIEYRDRTGNHPAVTMLQYFFSWEISTVGSVDVVIDNMVAVMSEDTPTFKWID